MYIGASAEGRREMAAEEELRRVIDCYTKEKMQEIQLKQKEKALAEQAKQIVELKAKPSSRKSK